MEVVLFKKQMELPIDNVRMQEHFPRREVYENEEPSRTDSLWDKPAFS
jgi:hypothetical protein